MEWKWRIKNKCLQLEEVILGEWPTVNDEGNGSTKFDEVRFRLATRRLPSV
jgi:hypothetical protein